MTPLNPHIEFQNVSTRYGHKDVLKNVSFSVQRNEVFGIIGPANSGKTTMLTLVCGLRTVQEGSVRTLGTELNGAGRNLLVQVRRNIGFIFQAHNLLGALTASENVQMGLELEKSTSKLFGHSSAKSGFGEYVRRPMWIVCPGDALISFRSIAISQI